MLLTRVGREREELAGPVAELVSAGGTALDIIDVPKGQHGFDMLDHTDESRAAVTKALDWAIAHLGEDPTDSLPATQSSTSTSTSTLPATQTSTSTLPRIPATAPEISFTELAAEPAFGDVAAPAAEPAFNAMTTPAQLPVPAATPATRTVERERAAYAAHDLEAFLAMYSPTAQLQFADGSLLKGRRSLREYYRPRFEAGRCKTELLQRMTVGGWVVDQVVLHDTDESPAPAITLYRVTDGLITEVRFLA